MKNDIYERILFEIDNFDMNSYDMLPYIHGACDVALWTKSITSSERVELLSIAIKRLIDFTKGDLIHG